MIRLHDVTKTYGDKIALHRTSLTIPPGQTTALLGPSGCGKSTLLRIVVGLIQPDRGWVELDGERVEAQNLRQLRHRMGYMIQDGGLFPHLKLRDNVTLLARHLKRPREWIEQRVVELAELVHLPLDLLDRYPVQVSGGQRQRVALMRALFLDPDVLLLDEPMGALDPMIRAELQQELRAIFRQLGKTVLLVTHDVFEAGVLADQVVLMRDGRVLQQGALGELIRSPRDPFVLEFINAQRSAVEALRSTVERSPSRPQAPAE